MAKAKKALVSLVVLFVAGCVTTGGYSLGDRVEYQRNKTFHLEPFVVYDGPLQQAIMNFHGNVVDAKWRANLAQKRREGDKNIMSPMEFDDIRKNIPESRSFSLFRAVAYKKYKQLDYASRPGGFLVDIRIDGLDARAVGNQMILSRGQLYAGTMRPRVLDSDSVVFEDFVIHNIDSVVLPMGKIDGKNVWGPEPAATILLKTSDCTLKNPSTDGKSVTYALKHRVHENGQGRVNTAQLVGLVVTCNQQAVR